MAFQTLNINGRIRMNSRVMNENGREGVDGKNILR